MVSSKQLQNRFQERVAPEMGVESQKGNPYSTTPKKDIYKVEQAYGGYRVTKQIKGSTAEKDISERYTAKEMDIYMKGMETGARVSKGKE